MWSLSDEKINLVQNGELFEEYKVENLEDELDRGIDLSNNT